MKRALVFLAAIASAAATASAAERPLYDPTADPAFDLARARTVAMRTRRNLLLEVGVDRIMFSVDHPYGSMADARAFLQQLPVSEADRERIAHGNAEKLLGL